MVEESVTYYQQCFELARDFLVGRNVEHLDRDKIIDRLAQHIQQAIEDFLAENCIK